IAPGQEPGRIAAHVGRATRISVRLPGYWLQRVAGHELGSRGVVVAGPHPVETGFGVEVLPRVLEWICWRAGRCRGVAIRVVAVGCLDRPRAVGEGSAAAQLVLVVEEDGAGAGDLLQRQPSEAGHVLSGAVLDDEGESLRQVVG